MNTVLRALSYPKTATQIATTVNMRLETVYGHLISLEAMGLVRTEKMSGCMVWIAQ